MQKATKLQKVKTRKVQKRARVKAKVKTKVPLMIATPSQQAVQQLVHWSLKYLPLKIHV